MTTLPVGVTTNLSRDRQPLHQRAVLTGLALLLAIAVVLALGTGAMPIPAEHVVGILLSQVGLADIKTVSQEETAVMLSVRLPRVALSLAVGAMLGLAGASLQSLFRNPLADPSLVGVADGAACGAVAWIVFGGVGLAGAGAWGLVLAAFAGGLITTFAVMSMSRNPDGHVDMATLLLAGLAMKALTGALLGYMIFLANDVQMRSLTFWMLGSLGNATWETILPATSLMFVALAILLPLGRPFDTLTLGEASAGHLGVNVNRIKLLAVAAVALGTGAATAVTGIIGFIGLMSPHIIRLTGGTNHQFLMPGSAILGALLAVSADTLARLLVVPAELPIGVVTSAIGAPFFLWLLKKRQALVGT